ncbi:anti-sigma factor [Pseudomonas thivervalensis]|uniref:anti-sigma factor n=1 Tax=Pseudomonas thivervalensis TaxID=86265 RepID=UPI003D6B151B
MTTSAEGDTPENIEELASEYVLGTLPAEQREQVRQRLAHEPALRNAVDAWEQRLVALTEQAEPQTPEPRVWRRIQNSLNNHDQRAPAAARPKSWWNFLPLWRGLAGAGIVATLLLGTLLLTRTAAVNPTSYLVVLVAPQNQAPGWVIQATDSREIQLIPLAVAHVPSDKALQFWTKADDWQAPVSLGLVQPGQTLSVPLDKLPPLEPHQLFELTLESANGSPTGKPTGPVQFIGRAVKVI